MEITDIKSSLTLAQVLHYYHLKPDKNLRLCCPFHDDKTPSLQVYYKTHTCYCFSSNCKTHGKSLDVIDFIMYKENITKHEAINRAKEMIEGKTNPAKAGLPSKSAADERANLLGRMFTYFKNGVHNSQPAKDYLEQRGLDHTNTEVGYNSGQFHHGARKDEALIKSCIRYGLLLDLGTKSRTGNKAYKSFGKWCIVFPLKNKQGQITGLYFRSTLDDKKQRHFYLKDRQGLYPSYPSKDTKKLILTESIIDAATMEAHGGIKGKYAVLALYGTNGLTEEHIEAIKEWALSPSGEMSEGQRGKEIIFFLNGDAPGIKAVEKYAPMLKGEYPNIKISNVQVPENEDVNSLLQGHSPDILKHLIDTRKEYTIIIQQATQQANFFLSNEAQLKEKKTEAPEVKTQDQAPHTTQDTTPQTGLDTSNPYNIRYQGIEADYQIKGFRLDQLDSLKITLQIAAK